MFCIEELPHFENVYQDYAAQGFQVFAINSYDSWETVIEAREQLELTFQILWDPGQIAANLYDVFICPLNVLVDGTGKIRYRLDTQLLTEATLRSWLEDVYGP